MEARCHTRRLPELLPGPLKTRRPPRLAILLREHQRTILKLVALAGEFATRPAILVFVLCERQRTHQDRGHFYGSARSLALWPLEFVAFGPLIPRPNDRDCGTHEVDVIPRKCQDLAATHSSRDSEQYGQMQSSPLNGIQKLGNLVFAEHLDSMSLGSRQFNSALGVGRVERELGQPRGLWKGLVQHCGCLN